MQSTSHCVECFTKGFTNKGYTRGVWTLLYCISQYGLWSSFIMYLYGRHMTSVCFVYWSLWGASECEVSLKSVSGIILYMLPANERRRYIGYIVMVSLIGWVHTRNDPWVCILCGNFNPEMVLVGILIFNAHMALLFHPSDGHEIVFTQRASLGLRGPGDLQNENAYKLSWKIFSTVFLLWQHILWDMELYVNSSFFVTEMWVIVSIYKF